MPICTQYERGDNEKGACSHWGGHGLCNAHGRLRCIQFLIGHQDQTSIEELLSHPEFTKINRDINTTNRLGQPVMIPAGRAVFWKLNILENLPAVYSFSQLGCYESCRRKWYLNYVKRVSTILRKHFFVVGTAGHAVLERYLQGIPIDDALKATADFEDAETGDAMFKYRLAGIRAVARVWAEEHPDLRGETEVSYEHPCLPTRAFVDMRETLNNGRKCLWEHKFASSIDYMPKYRSQANFYMMHEPDAERVVINILKKPDMRSFKPKKAEDLAEYEARVATSIRKDPRKYFAFHNIERDQRDLDETRDMVLHLVDELEGCRKAGFNVGFFPRNTGSCKMMNMECEFLPLCETGQLDPTVYKVAFKAKGRDVEEKGDDAS